MRNDPFAHHWQTIILPGVFLLSTVLMQCTWGQSLRLSSIQPALPTGLKKAPATVTAEACRVSILFNPNESFGLTDALFALQQSLPPDAIGVASVEIDHYLDWRGLDCIRLEGYPVYPPE